MEKINVTIIIDKKTDKHVEVTINKDAKLRDLLSEVSKSKNMEGINYLKFVLPDGNLVGPESLDKKLNELRFENKSQSWISPYTMDSDKKNDDKDKWEGWIDLKSIISLQGEKNKNADGNKDDTITLIINNYHKEVTRLNVTKTTTMREIKEKLQKQYNLSKERIDELKLWYNSGDIFYNLDGVVEQVFDEEDIKNCEVKVYAQGFDFDLKTNNDKLEADQKVSRENQELNDTRYHKDDEFGCFFKPNMSLCSRLFFSFKFIFCFAFAGKYPVSGKKSEPSNEAKYKIIRFFTATLLIISLPMLGVGIAFLYLSILLKLAIAMTAVSVFLFAMFIVSCVFISAKLNSRISSKQLQTLEKFPDGYKLGDSIVPMMNNSKENII